MARMHHEFNPYPFGAQHYPPKLPPLRNGADPQRHRVVVVGAALRQL